MCTWACQMMVGSSLYKNFWEWKEMCSAMQKTLSSHRHGLMSYEPHHRKGKSYHTAMIQLEKQPESCKLGFEALGGKWYHDQLTVFSMGTRGGRSSINVMCISSGRWGCAWFLMPLYCCNRRIEISFGF